MYVSLRHESSVRIGNESWSSLEFLCFMERTRRSSNMGKSCPTVGSVFRIYTCVFFMLAMIRTYEDM